MPTVNVLTCDSPSVDLTECIGPLRIQTITTFDQASLEFALITIDPDIVGAIVGGGLVLFVTGIGAGWLVNIIKQARL